MSQSFKFIVVGAGVHGLSTAYQLSRRNFKIAIFQQFNIGHDKGSSHGKSRITRCAYQTQVYRDMASLAKSSSWPAVQKQLGCKFIHQNPFVYFDPTENAANIKRTAQTDKSGSLTETSYKEMKQKFQNLFDIQNSYGVLDSKAGIVQAQLYIKKMGQYLKKQPNITVFQNSEVSQITSTSQGAKVHLKNGKCYQAQKVALSAGKYVTKHSNDLANILKPIMQIVCYLQLQDRQLYKVGKFPSFMFSCHDGSCYYGLPQTSDQGLKFAQHLLKGSPYVEDKEKRIDNTKRMANKIFGKRLVNIKKWQQCWYTMTKTEDFLIDWSDKPQRILIISACSGHGFKFGPLIGKIGADLLQKDKSINVFEENRQVFKIQYHLGVNLF